MQTLRNTKNYFRFSILSSRGGSRGKAIRIFIQASACPTTLWFPRGLGNNNTIVHVLYGFTAPRAFLVLYIYYLLYFSQEPCGIGPIPASIVKKTEAQISICGLSTIR